MMRIDTIEDLVRVLDEHPDWLEAVRTRLLSRELRELPERVSRLSAEVQALQEELHAFVAEMKAFREGTNEFVAEMKAFRKEMYAFVAEMKAFRKEMYAFREEMYAFRKEMYEFVAEMKAFRKEMYAFRDEMYAFRKEMYEFVAETKAFREEMYTFREEMYAFREEMYTFRDETNRRFKVIQDDLGVLKGAHARNAAERNVGLIARTLGLRERRVLDAAELFDLAEAAGADMGDDAIRSYVQADLVFEARNAQGAAEYVAVEVSYTANGRDTDRAIRNAGLLARFTGAPSRAAVASLRLDDRVEEAVASGQVAWYSMPRRALEAD